MNKYCLILVLVALIGFGCSQERDLPTTPKNETYSLASKASPISIEDSDYKIITVFEVWEEDATIFEGVRPLNPGIQDFIYFIEEGIDLGYVTFVKSNHQDSFRNKLDVVEKMITIGNYDGAINKINHDLRKTVFSWIVDPLMAYKVYDLLETAVFCMENFDMEILIDDRYFDGETYWVCGAIVVPVLKYLGKYVVKKMLVDPFVNTIGQTVYCSSCNDCLWKALSVYCNTNKTQTDYENWQRDKDVCEQTDVCKKCRELQNEY